MRLINTVEFRHHHATGEYVAPWTLDTAPTGRELLAARSTAVLFDPINRTVGRFRAFWRVSSDGAQYEVSLVDPQTGFAVFSDTVGEIFYGEAQTTPDPRRGATLRSQLAFYGSSIGPGTPSILVAIAGFFAPGLGAADTCSRCSLWC